MFLYTNRIDNDILLTLHLTMLQSVQQLAPRITCTSIQQFREINELSVMNIAFISISIMEHGHTHELKVQLEDKTEVNLHHPNCILQCHAYQGHKSKVLHYRHIHKHVH